MSGGTAQRDGSTLPPSVRFTASTDRLRTAIDNLDATAKAERIFPAARWERGWRRRRTC